MSGPNHLNYPRLNGLYMQDLEKKVDRLESENAKLRKEIEALRAASEDKEVGDLYYSHLEGNDDEQ